MPRRADQSPNLSSKVPQSPNMATKVPPMYSPRIDGGAVLASRLIPPSPLSKGLDGPASSTSVDYDDVFGGPPRLATTVFAAEDSHGPSATLDRSAARAPSFRSRALPVFELPVFGDEAFGSSNTLDQRTISVVYDDIFREEAHVPDIYPKYGNIPRSKASSRSASRRMSPAHPAAALAHQLLQEELYAAAKTGAFSKDREGRNSFSSSSFDEVRGKPGDPVSMVVRNDTVGSSLPASPRQSGMWGHVKRFTASKSVHNLGSASASVEIDDVFGGFPQRTSYSPVLQAANQDTSKSSRIPRAYPKCTAENSAPGSPLIVHRSDVYEGLGRALSRSSSSDREKEVQDDFAKIGMDKQSGAAPEKMEAAADRTWVTVTDLRQSAHSIPRKVSARLPPVPFPSPPSDGRLRHRSWKDWTSNKSECPPVFSSSSGLAQDTSMAFGNDPAVKKELNNEISTFQPNKGVLEARSLKQVEKNTGVQPRRGKFTLFSPLRTASKAKPVVEALQLEEEELSTVLKNSGKTNEKWEKIKSSTARTSEGPSDFIDPTMQDFDVEGKKLPSRSPKTLSNQHGSQSIEHKVAEPRWKAWKKHPSKEKMNMKESTKIGLAQESKQMKAPNHSVQDISEKRSVNSSKSNLLSECEDFFDPEKIVEVVSEEMSANGPRKETDRWYHTGLHAKSSRKVAEDVEIAGKRNPSSHLKDKSKASSALSSRNGTFQDFGQNSERQEVIFSKGIEEVESQVIGLDASLVGFQEIEGESVECREARWVCHLHAKEPAARALEEMQKRDAEVVRQQAETQQWAENGDRQIKRWATGKEGNLRALLSNMQQVLWADSGWKPISLTDLIEGPDVKKAYRKATLFVHPDKLQQKGATLQQKYIAERVFDILQEAWKTFNLQELF